MSTARAAERDTIKQIREKIFQLAKKSPSLEIMHWYMQLDDCFENNKFQDDELSNLRWRLSRLQDKHEPVATIERLAGEVLALRLRL